jgi:uncharacterized lipoprotein YmbA
MKTARFIASFAVIALTSLSGCIVRSQPGYYYQPAPRVYYTRPAPRVVYVQQPVAQPVYVQQPTATATVVYR